MALSESPKIKGTIGLLASSSPSIDVKILAFCSGIYVNSGLFLIISKAALLAATLAGGKAVE